MGRAIQSLIQFNRGIVSPLALARIDVKRIAMAAQTQTNWISRTIGYMFMRPGLQFIGEINGDLKTKMMRFVFAQDDVAQLEQTPNVMRVWINDALLSRPSVGTAVTNGTFPVDLTGWTNADDAGATSSWTAPNYMQLVGNGTAFAVRRQQVTVAGADVGIEHGIRIVIERGPVTLRIGSTVGGDEYLSETTLFTGTHSLSIVPTGSFYIQFSSRLTRKVWVSQCTIEAAGVVSVPTPWGATNLANIRYDQSGDVIFAACSGLQQRRIERRGARPNARGWSVVLYQANDGPFNVENTGTTTLTPSAITGNITIAASAALFNAKHVGALFSITSVGQQVTTTSAVSGTPTSSIRVTGVGDARTFSIVISGNNSTSTVDLQRSYDNATWASVALSSYTTNITTTANDGLENQIVYYRLNLTTRVAPDTITMTLRIGSGSIRGVIRVTDFTDSKNIGAEVLSDLGATSASMVWQEGNWSDLRGWPTSARLHEGRLWWSGKNGVWGSVSDAYDSFDQTIVGDSGPINRTIGSGPVDTIQWMASLKGLLLGAQGAEWTARASSLDEPLTPTSFNLKSSSNQGSGAVESLKVDQSCYFVNRSGVKVFDLSFDLRSYDYFANDLMKLCPELALGGIVRMDVQRLPETRVHCIRSDGVALVGVIDKAEEVICWQQVQTDGVIEDVAVLPAVTGGLEDQVYYVVQRTINGSTRRYLEKWAQETECRGDVLNKQADAFIVYQGVATTVISGLSHLEGKQVVVWADGADIGTDDSTSAWTQRYTVSGGSVTLASRVSNAVIGLAYTAPFLSAKIGLMGEVSPLNQQKRIGHIGMVLGYTHPRGVRYGAALDVTQMDDMPLIENGTQIGTTTEASYDENLIEFPGTWTTDARVALLGAAPRPCTVMGVTTDMLEFS